MRRLFSQLFLGIVFLSSPLFAQQKFFEKVNKELDQLKLKAMDAYLPTASEIDNFWKAVATPAQLKFLKTSNRAFRDLASHPSYTWKKNVPQQGNLLWIYGIKQEKIPHFSFRGGKETKTYRDKTTQVRILVRQENDGWKILKWETSCSFCNGKGVCKECGGTGMTKPKKCWSCQGTGKRKRYTKAGVQEVKCFVCKGTGKTKPYKCWSCQKTKGKCSMCKGKGWKNILNKFEEVYSTIPSVSSKNYFDLSTPKNAAQTILAIESQVKKRTVEKIGEFFKAVQAFAQKYFAQELIDSCKEKGKNRPFRLPGSSKDAKIKDVQKQGNRAIVLVEEYASVGGKTRSYTQAYFFLYTDGKWKWDNSGYLCWSCKGKGVCRYCHGKGKNCWSCKKNPGKCSTCQGTGFRMKRK
ncbi:MAG: hypothetical protein D6805_02510 [Planctomycetota bacterium]|nr:MAG: hypothetical protein D6805_02510 [Planctomycetota bacterium]